MQNKTDIVLDETKSVLKKIYGTRLQQLILFGSYARGEQYAESDIDLLVVLNDSTLSPAKEIRYINQSLFDLVLKYNTIISAHPVSAERYRNEPSFFFNRVKKEGKSLHG